MQNSYPHRRAWRMGVAIAMVLAVIGLVSRICG